MKYTYELTKKIVVTVEAETSEEALSMIPSLLDYSPATLRDHESFSDYAIDWDRAEVRTVLIHTEDEKKP